MADVPAFSDALDGVEVLLPGGAGHGLDGTDLGPTHQREHGDVGRGRAHAEVGLNVSSARAERELGVRFRPLEETLRDYVAWMRAQAAPRTTTPARAATLPSPSR